MSCEIHYQCGLNCKGVKELKRELSKLKAENVQQQELVDELLDKMNRLLKHVGCNTLSQAMRKKFKREGKGKYAASG